MNDARFDVAMSRPRVSKEDVTMAVLKDGDQTEMTSGELGKVKAIKAKRSWLV
jgi:hypothetical protein